MLNYTETPILQQTYVTTTRNTEKATWRFIGNMTLNPPLDVWVDTQHAPDQSITFGPSDSDIAETHWRIDHRMECLADLYNRL